MHTIENEYFRIDVTSKGAELLRIFSKQNNLDYLWDGDPAFWAKHSPVLFPIVGTLKDEAYHFEDKRYHLPRHGFARDMGFAISNASRQSLTFTLGSNDETLLKFPFPFRLDITYALSGTTLQTNYEVTNTGPREMYFSIGGHPAFKIPYDTASAFEDHYIEFAEVETASRWPVSHQGLLEALPLPLLNNTMILPLSHELFSQDALVLKHLHSKSLKLRSKTSEHGLTFHFEGFPYLGIWSAKTANFVCIEPWCGIADSVASDQQLLHKEGINMLTPGQTFSRQWSAEFF